MSHIVKINTKLKNIKALKRAVKEFKALKFNENEKSFTYYGSSTAQCDHTIELPGEKKMGIKKLENGEYEMLWDPGYTQLSSVIGRNAEKLLDEYSVAVATMEAEAEGMTVTRYNQKDGTIRLEAVYA